MTSAKTIAEIGSVAGPSSAPRSALPVGLPVGPAIPGLRFRPWQDISDYDAMAAVMVAASRADGVPWVPTGDQLRIDKQDSPTIDPARDIVLAEVDDRLVACAGADRVIRDATPIYETWGAVHPEMRRRGLGSALLEWNIARSRERAATLDPGCSRRSPGARRTGRGRSGRARRGPRLRDRPTLPAHATGPDRADRRCAAA